MVPEGGHLMKFWKIIEDYFIVFGALSVIRWIVEATK